MAYRLDNKQYSEHETVTLKVPMAVPYHIDVNEFERVDGEIEYKGEYYRLIKQKLEKDTLYIVCIKDQDSKRINQALADYVKTFTDKPANTKQSSKHLTSFIKDFLPSSVELANLSSGWDTTSPSSTEIDDFFSSVLLTVLSPPPQG